MALVPRGVASLVAAGHSVSLPPGAGAAAGYPDDSYVEAGAAVSNQPTNVDVLVAVGPISIEDAGSAGAVISHLDPLGNPAGIALFAAAGLTALAMEMIPRTTQAQAMDALSSQATAAGYEAVLAGAAALPRFMPMLMTAAGTIPPARALVLGVGVAGLQAIATARRLGAVVAAYDIRPAAREQVESLGATFVGGPVEESAEIDGGYAGEVDKELKARQLEALDDHIANADLVITTAAVPGRAAPVLVTRAMVDGMKAGSVIVDLAAATGGNCEVTVAGQTIDHGGVTVMGPLDLPSRTAGHASEMYSRNIASILEHLTDEKGNLTIDPDDEITAACLVANAGIVTNQQVRSMLEWEA